MAGLEALTHDPGARVHAGLGLFTGDSLNSALDGPQAFAWDESLSCIEAHRLGGPKLCPDTEGFKAIALDPLAPIFQVLEIRRMVVFFHAGSFPPPGARLGAASEYLHGVTRIAGEFREYVRMTRFG